MSFIATRGDQHTSDIPDVSSRNRGHILRSKAEDDDEDEHEETTGTMVCRCIKVTHKNLRVAKRFHAHSLRLGAPRWPFILFSGSSKIGPRQSRSLTFWMSEQAIGLAPGVHTERINS
jgi:hypothetical protein